MKCFDASDLAEAWKRLPRLTRLRLCDLCNEFDIAKPSEVLKAVRGLGCPPKLVSRLGIRKTGGGPKPYGRYREAHDVVLLPIP